MDNQESSISQQTSPDAQGDGNDGMVDSALKKFQIISNPLLRGILFYLPFILALFLLIDWLIGLNAFVGDRLRFPAVLVAIIDLLILRILFERVGEALRSVWAQGLIRASSKEILAAEAFASFLQQFHRLSNSRWSWLVGVVFALGIFLISLGGLTLLGLYRSPNTAMQLINIFFIQRLGFIGPVIGYLLGLYAWRVGVIAWYVYRLGESFEIETLPNHPDKCGGLKALGDISLLIAFILLVPAIYLSFWGIIVNYYNIPGTDFYALVWSGVFRKLLVLLSGLAFLFFFMPLYQIHVQMLRRRQELHVELDRISQSISQLSLEIRAQAERMDATDGKEKLESLEFLEKVYQKSSAIPTWPFDTSMLWKFAAGQAVPLLTLLGTNDSVTAMVQALFSTFSP